MNSVQVYLDKFLPKKVNYLKHSIISAILFVVGALMAFYVVQKLVTTIVTYMCILKPGRFTRQKHEDGLPFTYKFYLWNLTNPDQVAAGTESPKMQEIGPYVFWQTKRKLNVSDDIAMDTMSFDLVNDYYYDAESTAPLTGDEPLTNVHPVLAAVTAKVKYERPHQLPLVLEALDIMFKKPSSMFYTMSALDVILKGFEIDCSGTEYAVKLNKTIQGRYTVKRGVQDLRDVGRLVAFDGRPALKTFKELESCNTLNGTDKLFFPPFVKKTDILWAFSEDSHKSYAVRCTSMERVRGVRTGWFNLHLGDPLLNPACECNKYIGCATIGTIDLYPGYHVFLTGSLPHFYLSEPSKETAMEGMNPKAHLHRAGANLDLVTGAPVLANERYQINLLVSRIPDWPIFSKISDQGHLWIPMVWYDEGFRIENSDLALLIASRISKTMGIMTGYIMVIIGLMGMVTVAFRFHYREMIEPQQ